MKGVGTMSQGSDLAPAIYESELSSMSCPNSKRTALPCYTFQREKELLSQELEKANAEKAIQTETYLLELPAARNR